MESYDFFTVTLKCDQFKVTRIEIKNVPAENATSAGEIAFNMVNTAFKTFIWNVTKIEAQNLRER